MLYKIIGFFLLVLGAFIIRYFPDVSDYQAPKMTVTGIWVGIILVIVGLVMIIYA